MVPAAPANGATKRPVRPRVTPERPSPLSLLAVGRSAAVLTGGTMVAQFLNFAREFYLAATIGVSSDLDAFLIALVVPVTLAGALTTGATRALVPVYIEAADSRDAQRFAGNVMLWAGAAGLAIWMFVVQFADLTVTIAGPGLSVTAHDEAVGFLHTLAPLAFVSAIAAILYTVCQAEGRFGAIAVSTIAAPAVTLVTMLALWGDTGPWCSRARQSRGPDRWPPGAPSIDNSRFVCPDPDPTPRSASRRPSFVTLRRSRWEPQSFNSMSSATARSPRSSALVRSALSDTPRFSYERRSQRSGRHGARPSTLPWSAPLWGSSARAWRVLSSERSTMSSLYSCRWRR